MPAPIKITYYSDLLCVWADIGQRRLIGANVLELLRNPPEDQASCC